MKINKRNADHLWQKRYGDALWAEDFDGGEMYRYAYGDSDAYYEHKGKKIYCGWNLHHILPINKGGSNAQENLECTNIITNEQAGDKTTYKIDNNLYQVRKVKGTNNAYWIANIRSW